MQLGLCCKQCMAWWKVHTCQLAAVPSWTGALKGASSFLKLLIVSQILERSVLPLHRLRPWCGGGPALHLDKGAAQLLQRLLYRQARRGLCSRCKMPVRVRR